MIKTGRGRNDPCHCGSGKKLKHCCREKNSTAQDVSPGAETGVRDVLSMLQLALQHQQSGRAQAAIALLEQVLQLQPGQPDALHLLGVLAHGMGQDDLACDLFFQAIHANPRNAHYYSNLGNLLYAQGKIDAAVECFRQALALKPDYATVHYDLAVALQQQEALEPSIAHYRQALRLMPQHVDAYRNLGFALQCWGHFAEAESCYRQGLAVAPEDAEIHFRLAVTLTQEDKRGEAVQSYLKAIACKNDFAEAYANLGLLLSAEKRHSEAELAHRAVIGLRPDHADGYANLSSVLKDMNRLTEAVDVLKQALALNLASHEIYNNLAAISLLQGQVEESIRAYQKAVALAPDNASVYSNMLLTLQYSNVLSAADVFEQHLRFADHFECPLKADWPIHANPRDVSRRLRVGYVSGDFYGHPVANFFEPILAGHDKNQTETYCYYNGLIEDQVTQRLKSLSDHWLACSLMSDEQIANRIRNDGIDILVDLSGHTAYNRLLVFARKPAPIQATWIGYAGTTGLSAMDYRLTDGYMDPPGLTEGYHSEQLIRLPLSAPYRPEPMCPDVGELPALAGGGLMLASLNALQKINQNVANLWGKILARIPGSRLMLGNAVDEAACQHLIDLFGRAGVSPDRLVLQPKLSVLEYLALHQQIDLGLDPFPYNGGTTTMHSLWMGVPVVSMAGENMVSRCGVSLLGRVGLDHFIVHDEEEYLQRVLEIASDLPALSAIRKGLRHRVNATSGSFDAIVRDLESTYRLMWKSWCEGAPLTEK